MEVALLAYNSATNRFVIFELKLDSDKNVLYQATEYRDDIKKNFEWVYIRAKNKRPGVLPEDTQINRNADIVIVAKKFFQKQIEKAKAEKKAISLSSSTTGLKTIFFSLIITAKPKRAARTNLKLLTNRTCKILSISNAMRISSND